MSALGIETSCDETAVAIVRSNRRVIASKLMSQQKIHDSYGGVVPEIASRAHVEAVDHLVGQTLDESGFTFKDLDVVAVTVGPGLIGGLVVGTVIAQAIATTHNKPLVAVNHLEAHALTPTLSHGTVFPYLALLISGGHSQYVAVLGPRNYVVLGTTIDDSAGEAFDKISKMLGLGYPGGPAVEASALKGDPHAYSLPRPMVGRPDCNLSFSGLKTAVRQTILCNPEDFMLEQQRCDLCASFQAAVGDILADRSASALAIFRGRFGEPSAFVVCGGVAANSHIRQQLSSLCDKFEVDFVAPPMQLCGDNAVMIAWSGILVESGGIASGRPIPRARWPLGEVR